MLLLNVQTGIVFLFFLASCDALQSLKVKIVYEKLIEVGEQQHFDMIFQMPSQNMNLIYIKLDVDSKNQLLCSRQGDTNSLECDHGCANSLCLDSQRIQSFGSIHYISINVPSRSSSMKLIIKSDSKDHYQFEHARSLLKLYDPYIIKTTIKSNVPEVQNILTQNFRNQNSSAVEILSGSDLILEFQADNTYGVVKFVGGFLLGSNEGHEIDFCEEMYIRQSVGKIRSLVRVNLFCVIPKSAHNFFLMSVPQDFDKQKVKGILLGSHQNEDKIYAEYFVTFPLVVLQQLIFIESNELNLVWDIRKNYTLANFRCYHKDSEMGDVEAIINDHFLKQNIDTHQIKLHKTSVNINDTGIYWCEVQEKNETIILNSRFVKVIENPVIDLIVLIKNETYTFPKQTSYLLEYAKEYILMCKTILKTWMTTNYSIDVSCYANNPQDKSLVYLKSISKRGQEYLFQLNRMINKFDNLPFEVTCKVNSKVILNNDKKVQMDQHEISGLKKIILRVAFHKSLENNLLIYSSKTSHLQQVIPLGDEIICDYKSAFPKPKVTWKKEYPGLFTGNKDSDYFIAQMPQEKGGIKNSQYPFLDVPEDPKLVPRENHLIIPQDESLRGLVFSYSCIVEDGFGKVLTNKTLIQIELCPMTLTKVWMLIVGATHLMSEFYFESDRLSGHVQEADYYSVYYLSLIRSLVVNFYTDQGNIDIDVLLFDDKQETYFQSSKFYDKEDFLLSLYGPSAKLNSTYVKINNCRKKIKKFKLGDIIQRTAALFKKKLANNESFPAIIIIPIDWTKLNLTSLEEKQLLQFCKLMQMRESKLIFYNLSPIEWDSENISNNTRTAFNMATMLYPLKDLYESNVEGCKKRSIKDRELKLDRMDILNEICTFIKPIQNNAQLHLAIPKKSRIQDIKLQYICEGYMVDFNTMYLSVCSTTRLSGHACDTLVKKAKLTRGRRESISGVIWPHTNIKLICTYQTPDLDSIKELSMSETVIVAKKKTFDVTFILLKKDDLYVTTLCIHPLHAFKTLVQLVVNMGKGEKIVAEEEILESQAQENQIKVVVLVWNLLPYYSFKSNLYCKVTLPQENLESKSKPILIQIDSKCKEESHLKVNTSKISSRQMNDSRNYNVEFTCEGKVGMSSYLIMDAESVVSSARICFSIENNEEKCKKFEGTRIRQCNDTTGSSYYPACNQDHKQIYSSKHLMSIKYHIPTYNGRFYGIKFKCSIVDKIYGNTISTDSYTLKNPCLPQLLPVAEKSSVRCFVTTCGYRFDRRVSNGSLIDPFTWKPKIDSTKNICEYTLNYPKFYDSLNLNAVNVWSTYGNKSSMSPRNGVVDGSKNAKLQCDIPDEINKVNLVVQLLIDLPMGLFAYPVFAVTEKKVRFNTPKRMDFKKFGFWSEVKSISHEIASKKISISLISPNVSDNGWYVCTYLANETTYNHRMPRDVQVIPRPIYLLHLSSYAVDPDDIRSRNLLLFKVSKSLKVVCSVICRCLDSIKPNITVYLRNESQIKLDMMDKKIDRIDYDYCIFSFFSEFKITEESRINCDLNEKKSETIYVNFVRCFEGAKAKLLPSDSNLQPSDRLYCIFDNLMISDSYQLNRKWIQTTGPTKLDFDSSASVVLQDDIEEGVYTISCEISIICDNKEEIFTAKKVFIVLHKMINVENILEVTPQVSLLGTKWEASCPIIIPNLSLNSTEQDIYAIYVSFVRTKSKIKDLKCPETIYSEGVVASFDFISDKVIITNELKDKHRLKVFKRNKKFVLSSSGSDLNDYGRYSCCFYLPGQIKVKPIIVEPEKPLCLKNTDVVIRTVVESNAQKVKVNNDECYTTNDVIAVYCKYKPARLICHEEDLLMKNQLNENDLYVFLSVKYGDSLDFEKQSISYGKLKYIPLKTDYIVHAMNGNASYEYYETHETFVNISEELHGGELNCGIAGQKSDLSGSVSLCVQFQPKEMILLPGPDVDKKPQVLAISDQLKCLAYGFPAPNISLKVYRIKLDLKNIHLPLQVENMSDIENKYISPKNMMRARFKQELFSTRGEMTAKIMENIQQEGDMFLITCQVNATDEFNQPISLFKATIVQRWSVYSMDFKFEISNHNTLPVLMLLIIYTIYVLYAEFQN